MEANDITLQALINAPKQFMIPVFQRYYAWRQEDWEALWSDLKLLTRSENQVRTHFMGSLVFFPIPSAFDKNPGYQVIDGQQRLVTFSLILSVLRYLALQHGEEALASEIEENFLVHRFKKGEERYRVYPRQRDRKEYLEAVSNPNTEIDGSIGDAFRFFVEEIVDHIQPAPAERLKALFDLLKARVQFVYIQLDGENPYEIFKSLNSRGVPLSESDLIRNFVFMHVRADEQDEFDDKLWRPLEAHFEYTSDDQIGEVDSALATRFFRDYLMKAGTYVTSNAVFETFEKKQGGTFAPDTLAQDLHRTADLYDIIRGVKSHQNAAVDASLHKLRQLESTTTYPLLVALLEKARDRALPEDELVHSIELITGFILRRYATSESSRPYNRWFVSAAGELADNPLENLNRFLWNKGFPTDRQFKASFATFPWYVRGYSRVVLTALERASAHKEPADLSNASIEHIMPQTLSEQWRADLGERAKGIHDEWLHTIGNLTLSGYNPELLNRPFAVKRQEYERSNITLNRDLLHYTSWGEEQIKDRADHLADLAAAIWIGPDEVLDTSPLPDDDQSKVDENGLTPVRQLQLDFWTALNEFLLSQNSSFTGRKPRPTSWTSFPIGRWEFNLGGSIHFAEKRVEVFLAMTGPNAKRHYQILHNQKAAIQAELGTALNWHQLPKKKSSFITIEIRDFDPADRSTWPHLHAWMQKWLEAFYHCFQPRTEAMRNLNNFPMS